MLRNASMPQGEVIPVLAYQDVAAAAAWLTRHFGFGVRWIADGHRAQLAIGGSGVAITAAAAAALPGAPGWVTSLMVRVDDVDATAERARVLGATILAEPATFPYGERQCTILDHEGNRWTFSETVADVDPTEWGATPG